jgi:subtilisin family serine protease
MPHSAEATPNLVRIGAVVGVKSNMRASRALVQSASTQDVVVGLIDTGCDVTNKNLNIVGGMDFTSDDSYGLDGNGHGTHVAGGLNALLSSCTCERTRILLQLLV